MLLPPDHGQLGLSNAPVFLGLKTSDPDTLAPPDPWVALRPHRYRGWEGLEAPVLSPGSTGESALVHLDQRQARMEHSVRAPVLAAAGSPNVVTVIIIRAGLTWVGLGEHVFVQKVPEKRGEISGLAEPRRGGSRRTQAITET